MKDLRSFFPTGQALAAVFCEHARLATALAALFVAGLAQRARGIAIARRTAVLHIAVSGLQEDELLVLLTNDSQGSDHNAAR